jgi:hypothetical protein
LLLKTPTNKRITLATSKRGAVGLQDDTLAMPSCRLVSALLTRRWPMASKLASNRTALLAAFVRASCALSCATHSSRRRPSSTAAPFSDASPTKRLLSLGAPELCLGLMGSTAADQEQATAQWSPGSW